MKMKSMMLLLVAAGFGLVAMLGVMQVLNGKGDEPMVKVAVATADIPAGMPLDDTNVGFKEFQQSTVPSGAVTKQEEYAGKALVSRAVPGEIIMTAKLGGADSITASHQIPKGMRVATVSVNATKSHSGLIRPTDRVDVVCTYDVPNPVTRQKSTHVKTVLEFIEVFAVDALRAGREGDVEVAVKNVSLIVDPEQFQLLKAAEGLGELNLSLRNREDKEKTQVAELSDNVFFQRDTSIGTRTEPAKSKSAAEPVASQGPGLQDFLASAMTAMSETATVKTSQSAETPTWVMTIYRGVETQDIEVLDEAALPKGMSSLERQRQRARTRTRNDHAEPALPPSPAVSKPAAAAAPTPAAPAAPPALTPISEPVAEPAPAAQAAAGPTLPALFLPTLN
ncbi:MAG: Flp pilus assembly protein CpaB [Planctomycetota bacterium]|nr:Flp pilus assembly protein CpaB [Planctomycetaceae bacterium]MDQ3332176.1 Flp pilus assembly protein CpaB [Planctomycetota bacterium]